MRHYICVTGKVLLRSAEWLEWVRRRTLFCGDYFLPLRVASHNNNIGASLQKCAPLIDTVQSVYEQPVPAPMDLQLSLQPMVMMIISGTWSSGLALQVAVMWIYKLPSNAQVIQLQLLMRQSIPFIYSECTNAEQCSGRTVAKKMSSLCCYVCIELETCSMDGSGVGGPNRHPAIVRF